MPAESNGAASIADQAKRLQLAETLLQVSRTVSAMETRDEVFTQTGGFNGAALPEGTEGVVAPMPTR